MSSTPVSRMLVFAFVSVAMVAGFVVIALIAVPLRGDREAMPVVWSLFLLPVPALFAAFAFWFVTQGVPGRRVAATLSVLLAGIGATLVLSSFGGLLLVAAPLATAVVSVLATRLLDTA